MKLCFSMTHTYTSSSSICRASVNPAPSSLPNPSNSHVLQLLLTGGYFLQRPGCPHFAHVSVIEGRNLARLDRSSAWLHLLARPVHAHTSTHAWRTGHSVLFPFVMSEEMSGLPLLHTAWARPRESARRASSFFLPLLACLLCTCIITGSPTTPGLGTRSFVSVWLPFRGRPRFRYDVSGSSSAAHLLARDAVYIS